MGGPATSWFVSRSVPFKSKMAPGVGVGVGVSVWVGVEVAVQVGVDVPVAVFVGVGVLVGVGTVNTASVVLVYMDSSFKGEQPLGAVEFTLNGM